MADMQNCLFSFQFDGGN